MEMSYSSFILKWESEPRQCLRSPPLSHLSPSPTLSGCHWESHQLLFFISKRSIDALLAPVRLFSVFLCSLGSSVAAQAAARACETRPKLGLPCSDLQITQELCSTPQRDTVWTPVPSSGVLQGSTPCGRFSSMKTWKTVFACCNNNKGLSSRIILECLWLIQNDKIRCF